MNNGYTILKRYPGVSKIIINKDENEIDDAMEQVAFDIHVDPCDEDVKDEKGTRKDDISDGYDDGDDNKDPD